MKLSDDDAVSSSSEFKIRTDNIEYAVKMVLE